MELVAEDVAVTGPQGPLLRPTSLRVQDGELVVVSGDPNSGHTALALALAGRLRPSQGAVRLDGSPAPSTLRRIVTVVDSPEVTEPEGALPVSEVVAEELSLAGRPAGRRAARSWLAKRGFSDHSATRIDAIPPALRTEILVELAATKRGVKALILDCPDRHGGDPMSWYSLAMHQAMRGLAVVVLCSPFAAEKLGTSHSRIGATPPQSPELDLAEGIQ